MFLWDHQNRFLSSLVSGFTFLCSIRSVAVGRDSAVGITTGYGADGPGIESRWGTRLSAPVQPGPGAHPVYYTMDIVVFPGIMRPGRGVDNPPHLAPTLKKE